MLHHFEELPLIQIPQAIEHLLSLLLLWLLLLLFIIIYYYWYFYYCYITIFIIITIITIITLPVFLCWFVSEPVDHFQPSSNQAASRRTRPPWCLFDPVSPASVRPTAQKTRHRGTCKMPQKPRRREGKRHEQNSVRKIRKSQDNIEKSFENPCEVFLKKKKAFTGFTGDWKIAPAVRSPRSFKPSGVPVFPSSMKLEIPKPLGIPSGYLT